QREDAVIINCVMAGCNSGWNILILSDLYPKATKGVGHLRKVWVFQLGTRDSAGIVALLVGADGAILLVVHNDDERFGTVLSGSSNFLTVHKELAVAGNRYNTLFGVIQRHGNGRWNGVPHRTISGRDQRSVVVGREVPVHPVGVLASAEGNHCIVRQGWYQVSHEGIHCSRTCCGVFGWQCGEPFLLAAHFRRPGCPFGFIGQFHADKVANKSGWFCHDLVGYWAGAASQGRVNGYQEVLFIPVLSNG